MKCRKLDKIQLFGVRGRPAFLARAQAATCPFVVRSSVGASKRKKRRHKNFGVFGLGVAFVSDIIIVRHASWQTCIALSCIKHRASCGLRAENAHIAPGISQHAAWCCRQTAKEILVLPSSSSGGHSNYSSSCQIKTLLAPYSSDVCREASKRAPAVRHYAWRLSFCVSSRLGKPTPSRGYLACCFVASGNRRSIPARRSSCRETYLPSCLRANIEESSPAHAR